jgi:hypothetical protein
MNFRAKFGPGGFFSPFSPAAGLSSHPKQFVPTVFHFPGLKRGFSWIRA